VVRSAWAKESAPETQMPLTAMPVAPSSRPPIAARCPTCVRARGGGREFKYGLPADGMKVKDAWRVAFHLITVCEDYEPETMGSPMQVMAAISNRDGAK